jgi:non-ribosomal peptide synthetase component F
MMAIEMVGGVYCPLSPRDPQHRLHALIQQTQSRLVLVHWLTKTNFQNDVMSVNIDSVLINNNDIESDVDFNRLSSVLVTSDNIAYIIFTSGSTGTPKAVSDKTDNELVLYHYLIFDRLKFDIEILLSVCIPWLSLM